jgi:hypothetical protein
MTLMGLLGPFIVPLILKSLPPLIVCVACILKQSKQFAEIYKIDGVLLSAVHTGFLLLEVACKADKLIDSY